MVELVRNENVRIYELKYKNNRSGFKYYITGRKFIQRIMKKWR
jgi:hypothetical protein